MTKYATRTAREREWQNHPLPNPVKLLSGNKKTGISINLPLLNCIPSKRCSETCYACEGPIAFKNSIRKTLKVDAVLRSGAIEALVDECRKEWDVRLNGTGDLTLEHVDAILFLATSCPNTIFWGFTRSRPVAEELNNQLENLSIVLSYDSTMSPSHVDGYEGPIAFGPVQAQDTIPDDPRIIVVFPEHHQSHPDPYIMLHPKDCPATRFEVKSEKVGACGRCRRCFKPHDAME